MSKTTPVFISHASQDDPVADLIAEELENRGIESWVDHRNIRSGQEWDHSIHAALKTSAVGVFILTNDSHHSRECHYEWNFLLQQSKKLHLVLYNEHELEDFSYRLHTLQRINLDKGLDRGIALLAEAISLDLFPLDTATPWDIERGLVRRMLEQKDGLFKVIRITLDYVFEQLEKQINNFLRKLSNFLNIGRHSLALKGMWRGSTILELKMPAFAADTLELEMRRGKSAFLQEYGFRSIETLEIIDQSPAPQPPKEDSVTEDSDQFEQINFTTLPLKPSPENLNKGVPPNLLLRPYSTLFGAGTLLSFIGLLFSGMNLLNGRAPSFGQAVNLFRDIQSLKNPTTDDFEGLKRKYPFLEYYGT